MKNNDRFNGMCNGFDKDSIFDMFSLDFISKNLEENEQLRIEEAFNEQFVDTYCCDCFYDDEEDEDYDEDEYLETLSPLEFLDVLFNEILQDEVPKTSQRDKLDELVDISRALGEIDAQIIYLKQKQLEMMSRQAQLIHECDGKHK